jgi:hypothetical protein
MEKVALLAPGVTEPHPMENITCTRLIATHRIYAYMMDAVGCCAVSS